MNQKKFSASEWKDAVEKDLVEIKTMLLNIAKFIDTFEQWRSLPFNQGENRGTSNEKESPLSSNSSKSKRKPRGKDVRRKARAKNK